MNPRLQELADKAQQYAEYMTPQGLNCWDNFKEQFAWLIVADIIKIVEPDSYHQAYPDNVMGSYGGLELLENKVSKIKKHFDVR